MSVSVGGTDLVDRVAGAPDTASVGSAEHLPTSVLRRAFSLLEVLGAADRSMGMAELAKRAGMPKATAYRMANQLVELQVIDRVGNEYRIGLKLFQLDARARHQEMREVALPFLEDLQAIVQETVHLGVLDGSEVLYLERVAGRGVPTGTPARGSRGELHCSALGKVMLAHLDGDLVQRVLQEGLTRRPRSPSRRPDGCSTPSTEPGRPVSPTSTRSTSWASPASPARCSTGRAGAGPRSR